MCVSVCMSVLVCEWCVDECVYVCEWVSAHVCVVHVCVVHVINMRLSSIIFPTTF